MTKAPKITTNEGKAPKSVRITATVAARPDSTYPMVMKPYKLDVSQFGDKVRREIKLTISNVSDKDYKISLIDSPIDLFEIDLPSSIPAGGSAEAVVTLTEHGTKTDFEKSFTIEVNDEQTTRYTVPIKRKTRRAKL